MLEKVLEDKLRKAILAMGGLALKFTSPSMAGVPDRIIMFPNGIIFFVEMKRPKGGKVSPEQKIVKKEFAKYGHIVHTIWTPEQLEDFLFYLSVQ